MMNSRSVWERLPSASGFMPTLLIQVSYGPDKLTIINYRVPGSFVTPHGGVSCDVLSISALQRSCATHGI